MPVSIFSSAGVSEAESLLCVPPGYLTNFAIAPLSADICSVTLQPAPPCGYSLRAVTCPGRTLFGSEDIAWLSFTTLSSQSAFVPLLLTNVVALKPSARKSRPIMGESW